MRSEITGSTKHSHANIEYEYVAHNGMRNSDRIRFFQFNNKQMVKQYPEGAKVAVYVDPDDSSVAVLRSGIEPGDAIALMFFVPFNSITLAFLTAGPIGWIAGMFGSVSTGTSEDRFTRLVNRPGRITRGLLVASLASILSVFTLTILDLQNSWTPVSVAAFIICLTGLGAAILPAPRALSGDSPLELDHSSQTLKLPNRAAGIVGQTLLRFDEIQDVSMVPSRDRSPLKRNVFDVVLTLKTGKKLVAQQFTTKERAQKTVDNLIQHVFFAEALSAKLSQPIHAILYQQKLK